MFFKRIRDSVEGSTDPLKSFVMKHLADPDVAAQVDRVSNTFGSLGHDPWGLSRDSLICALTQFKPIYEKYFRTQAFGCEHIPKQGRVMVIGNHSGQLPIDGLLVGYALMMNMHGPRAARAMVERWIPTVPYVGNFLNSIGAVVGDPSNCRRILRREEVVIVFPEGARGSGKTFNKKYELQRFGTGFMHLAISENTPILPVGIVGCEETFPSIADIKPLAKLLGIPYFPVMPLIPIPTKVRLYFGEPVYYKSDKGTEEELERNVDDVKARINALIQKGLVERQGWFK